MNGLNRYVVKNLRVVVSSTFIFMLLVSPYDSYGHANEISVQNNGENLTYADENLSIKIASDLGQSNKYLPLEEEASVVVSGNYGILGARLEESETPVEETLGVSSDYEILGAKLEDLGTPEELDLLYRVVKAEVTCDDFEAKCNVASVMLNRLKSYGTLSGVLVESQFSSIKDGRASKMKDLDLDKYAVEYVLYNGDTTSGAYFFDSTRGSSYASRCKVYIFTDSVGHAFYEK